MPHDPKQSEIPVKPLTKAEWQRTLEKRARRQTLTLQQDDRRQQPSLLEAGTAPAEPGGDER